MGSLNWVTGKSKDINHTVHYVIDCKFIIIFLRHIIAVVNSHNIKQKVH